MANNRWIGKAQPLAARRAFFPVNVSPGSTWLLRVGPLSYEYTYPASIIDEPVSEEEKSQAVTEGLVAAIGAGTFAGGAVASLGSVESGLVGGKWAVIAIGSSDGAPIDVELTGDDASTANVKIAELQTGQAAQNERQIIRWPKTPTGGHLVLTYRDQSTHVDFDASAAVVQTALQGLSSIGSGNVTVTGSYTAGYVVEFIGDLAGEDNDLIDVRSNDSVGTAAVSYELTDVGGYQRTTYTLGEFSHDSDDFFRFTFGEEQSHLFSGAATEEQLTDAIESIAGLAGNVVTVRNSDGTTTIRLVAKFAGQPSLVFSIESMGDAATPSLEVADGSTERTQRVQTIRILNAPHSGEVTISRTRHNSPNNNVTSSSQSFQITADLSAIETALSSLTLVESATVERDFLGNFVITLTMSDGYEAYGLYTLDVSSLVGCNAIEVLRKQEARPARSAMQQIALHGDPDGGTFTLTLGGATTGNLAYNVSAAAVQTALEGLAGVGSGNVAVDGNNGGAWVVIFQGSLAASPIGLMTGDGANLTIVDAAEVTVTDTQTPTGPNWWTNPKNWSLGTVPGATDIVIFESGSVSCRYGISDVPAFGGLKHYRTFTGEIGLAETLDDGTPQTLPQYLGISGNSSKIDIQIGLGQEGDGAGVVRIDTQSQLADVSILHANQSINDRTFAVGLAGKLGTVSIGSATVGIAVGSTLSATVDQVRIAPPGEQAGNATLSWGSGAVITAAESFRSTLRGSSLPGSFVAIDTDATLQGSGTLGSLNANSSTIRYHATGGLGKQGDITTVADDGGSQVVVTSAGHGLSTGDRVFVRDLFAFDDGYYSIEVTDANTFVLLGSDISFITGNGVFNSVFGGGSVPGEPQWGLADSIRLGVGATLDFSEVGAERTLVAPILLQAEDARIVDPLISVYRLRWRCDPGFLTDDYGRSTVFQREAFRGV